MSDFYDYIKSPDLWKKSGKRIQARRKEKGITSQGQLADLIGVERRLPGEWEIGKHHIKSTADLAALARILEVDPEYITCQIDTYRAEHADAAAKYGLSEKTLAILAFDYSGTSYDGLFENPETIASAIDCIVQNINLSRALIRLIESEKDAAKKPDSFIPSPYNDFFDDTHIDFCQNDSPNYRGIDGEIRLSNRQAAFMSEQEFIYLLRKALE